MLGDSAQAGECLDDLHLASDLTGFPWFDWFGLAYEVALHFMRGEFAAAETKARRAHRVGREWPEAETDHVLGTQLFLIRRETGRLGAVATSITGREPLAECWAPGLLALYTELGMRRPTRRVLQAMAAPETLAENNNTRMWTATLAHLTEAAVSLGDQDVMRRLRPYLSERAGHFLGPSLFTGFYGTANYHLANLSVALGEGDPLEHFEVAEKLDRRCGARVHLAATLAARARYVASREGPRSPRVRNDVEEACALALPIGQARVLNVLDTVSADARLVAGPAPDTARGAGLSEREIEVLGLLVAGDSNRSIAESLHISENTAAKHVSSILAKTRTASRTAATHHALTHGWFETG